MLKIKSLFEYLFDNIFDIATILIAGFLVIREQIQPTAANNYTELTTWILAVLGLLAVSGVWQRNRQLRRIENLAQEGKNLISRRLNGKVFATDFFRKEKLVLDKTFSSADVIYVSGMTLARTTRDYMHIWGQRLIAGATIRVVILEINEPLLHEVAQRSAGETTVEYWHKRLQTAQSQVSYIAKTPGSMGKIELGYMPYVPSFGLFITDPSKTNAQCFVELYHHESPTPNPTFEVTLIDDPQWFRFFLDQFEIMWKSCRVETFDHTIDNKKSG